MSKASTESPTLSEVGLATLERALDADEGDLNAVVLAVAAMLEAHGSKRPKPRSGVDIRPYYDALLDSGAIEAGGCDPAACSGISKKLASIGARPEDAVALKAWVQGGGLAWLKGSKLTWNQVARGPKWMLLDWIIKARAYKPPQQLELQFR